MDTETLTEVEMKELTLADVQGDKVAEKSQTERRKDQEKAQEEEGDGRPSVYATMSITSKNASMAALIRSTSRQDKDIYRKLRLYKWISAVFIILSLMLLAAVLALGIKLYESQSSQECPQPSSLKMEKAAFLSNQEYQCSDCPKDWVRVNNSCYVISKERLSWQESRESCQRQGGDLTIIDNENVQKLLSGARGLLYWVGLRYSEKGWMWINNMPLTQGYWARDQPGSNPQGSCAMLRGQMPYKNNWFSNPCPVSSHYVCQLVLKVGNN